MIQFLNCSLSVLNFYQKSFWICNCKMDFFKFYVFYKIFFNLKWLFMKSIATFHLFSINIFLLGPNLGKTKVFFIHVDIRKHELNYLKQGPL